jgi:RsiW-degrading membrane proteinase PrsW (M82 family)
MTFYLLLAILVLSYLYLIISTTNKTRPRPIGKPALILALLIGAPIIVVLRVIRKSRQK